MHDEPHTEDHAWSGSGPDQRFAEFMEQGAFMIQRSRSTGRHLFYPRVLEPGGGSADLEWVEPSGRGTVYATTIVRAAKPGQPDFNIALIELEEGPRLMSRVIGVPPDAVKIGLQVRAEIGEIDGRRVVLFAPAEAGST